MTVSVEDIKVTYPCDGTEKEFDFDFQVFQTSDIKVILITVATGAEEVLDETTHYAVTGSLSAGGKVTTVSAYSSDYELLITIDIDLDQETDLIYGGRYSSQAVETMSDKLTKIAQQHKETLSRAIKFKASSDEEDVEIENLVANKAIVVSSGGDKLEMGPSGDEISSAQTYAEAAETAETGAVAAQGAAETAETNAAASAASLNIASPVASKEGALLIQNADDDGYDLLSTQGTSGQVLKSGGPNAKPSFQDETEGESTDVIEMNILLLAFKIAVADSLTKFNMVDGVSDAFVDESGVDAGDSVNEEYNSGSDYYSPGGAETWSDILDADVAGYADHSVRTVISAASISISGNKIRVTVEGSAAEGTYIDNLAIVERDGSSENGTTTPTEILFGESSGIEIAAGETEVSDWLTYALDETKDYLLIADIGSNTDHDAMRRIVTGGDGVYWKDATNSYNTQALGTPDTTIADATYIFVKLEVTGDMTLVSEATEAITQPDEIRIVIMEEDVDTITINTNFFGDVSRDDGNNWVEVTLEKAVDYASGKQILSGVGNVSGQAADKTIRCRTRSTDGDAYKIHNWGMAWK